MGARDRTIRFRVSDVELEALRDRAGLHHVSEYIRAAALGRTPRLPRQIPAINQSAWQDLSRTLSNLNQLTRAVHRGEIPADIETGKTLLHRIDELNARVRDLRANLIGAAAQEALDDRQAG